MQGYSTQQCKISLSDTNRKERICAASERVVGVFLLGPFIMACGESFLEVTANPHVPILGPSKSAERRLNIARPFNAVSAAVRPTLGSYFILARVPQRFSGTAMTLWQSQSLQVTKTKAIELPYLWIALIFLAVAVVISFSKLPGVLEFYRDSNEVGEEGESFGGIMECRYFVKGVDALLFNVCAQNGVTSFILRLV